MTLWTIRHPLQVAYAARHEMCEFAEDFLARRTRLAFVDVAAAEEALPKARLACSMLGLPLRHSGNLHGPPHAAGLRECAHVQRGAALLLCPVPRATHMAALAVLASIAITAPSNLISSQNAKYRGAWPIAAGGSANKGGGVGAVAAPAGAAARVAAAMCDTGHMIETGE